MHKPTKININNENERCVCVCVFQSSIGALCVLISVCYYLEVHNAKIV
jgi:hypothetical protein